jgi:hypothetical protein
MDTLDLIDAMEILRKYKNFDYVVCAKNELPSKIKFFPTLIIVNTDPAYKKGEHWLGMWFDKDEKNPFKIVCNFIDSFSNRPEFYSLNTYIEKNSDEVLFFTRQYQSKLSLICGPFIIFCFYKLISGLKFYQLVLILGNYNSLYNDRRVLSFIKNLMPFLKIKKF